ncbi:MAG: hypothetical protein ABIJ31_11255 [Pseudomonadota bacterium]
MEDVSKINQTESIQPDRPGDKAFDKKKHKRKKPYHAAKQYFDKLSKIVDETHRELENSNSPFRLCVYQEGEDIYIDVVTIDDTGKTSQIFKHDISHAEVDNLIQQIKSGTGLILNADV